MKSKKQRISMLVILVSILGVLSGCQETPKAEEKAGIYYAEGKADQGIEDILNEQDSDSISMDMEKYQLQKSIGINNAKINLDATVNNVDLSEVSVMTAEPFADMFDGRIVENLFFNEDDEVKDITEQVKQEENNIQGTIQEIGGESVVTVGMPSTNRMCMESSDGRKVFSRITDSSFNFINDKLNTELKQALSGEYEYSGDGQISGYNSDSAIEDIETVMKKLGFEDIKIVSINSSFDETQSSFDIEFTPIVCGLPLVFNNNEQNVDNIVDVLGTVTISEAGIVDLQATNCMWKVLEKTDTKCMDIDKAVKILEQYLLSGDVAGSENITFTKIELAYLPTTENWKTITLTPVWRFYVPLDERENIDMNEVYSKNIPLDICINAINGEIEWKQ